MKRIEIILTAILISLLLSSILCAQPAAFNHVVTSLDNVKAVVPEPIDLQAVLVEDQQREQNGGPYSFAISRPVNITPITDGLWEELDEETLLWQLPIASPEALSLSLGFSHYFMPSGGRLCIYSADESQVIGPFTEDDNKEHGQLWTPLIFSEAIIVEVTVPVSKASELELELTSINHGYRQVDPTLLNGVNEDADWCHRNVACPEGDLWRDQIRSVALYHITYGDRSYWCTGSLINNTSQNDKPYFLTSFRCFDGDRNRILEDPDGAAKSMVVYWNFQSNSCYSYSGSLDQNQTGAIFRSGFWKTDFLLVELEREPSSAINVYYSGWDRSSKAPPNAVAIHHPNSDVKKISIENDPLSKATLIDEAKYYNYGLYFVVNDWDVGITAEGSTGGPLFNPDKRIIGQFRNGNSSCSAPGPDWFGPFYRSWSEGENRNNRLKDWLDPLNTNIAFIDGKNPTNPSCQNVIVGTGIIDWEFPMHTWYHDSRTQVIYLSSEIRQSGTITGLALDVSRIPGQTLNNWTIRMKHTDRIDSTDKYMYTSGWTIVYSGNENVIDTGWKWFEFHIPFQYDNTFNLMVDFSHNNNSYSRAGYCRASRAESIRTLFAYSDSEDGDPLGWTESNMPNSNPINWVPNLKLKFCGQ
jgi:lysyl endopeptidase